jgi:hypothetical protein
MFLFHINKLNPQAMKSTQKTKKFQYDKASIDLPDQKTWKDLERIGMESVNKENLAPDCKNIKKVERILDKAFDLLLNKLIRQN